MENRLRKHGELLACVAICFAAAALGSMFTSSSVGGWYRTLAKPSWNPPDWVFGPVWSALYLMMAVSLWLAWRAREREGAKRALASFAVQLALNVAWSALFFGLKAPGWAFVEILLLWAAIGATIALFRRISRAAAWLLVPYFLWVSFAACLNFALWRLQA